MALDQILDRLDVKHCIGDRGRKRDTWLQRGSSIVRLNDVLTLPTNRTVIVEDEDSYRLLKVTYGGEILEGDTLLGDDSSYKKLFRVEAWDVVLSSMGVGRGAIGIVPSYLCGYFVSNEYTILKAKSPEEALYYTSVIPLQGDTWRYSNDDNRSKSRSNQMGLDGKYRSTRVRRKFAQLY